jgi:hypothetical protein
MLVIVVLVVMSLVTLVAAYLLGMHAASARIREKTSEVFRLPLPRRSSNGRSPLMLGTGAKAEVTDESSRLTSSAFFPAR